MPVRTAYGSILRWVLGRQRLVHSFFFSVVSRHRGSVTKNAQWLSLPSEDAGQLSASSSTPGTFRSTPLLRLSAPCGDPRADPNIEA